METVGSLDYLCSYSLPITLGVCILASQWDVAVKNQVYSAIKGFLPEPKCLNLAQMQHANICLS